MRTSALVMPVVLAVAAAPLLATPASAGRGHGHGQPVCGTTLTRDTVLERDLTCPGAGLTLGEGVDLDLRGHTLRGPGTGTGITVTVAGSNRVGNGTVTGWTTGTAILEQGVVEDRAEPGPLRVERVTFRGNTRGVDASGETSLGGAKPTTVVRSTFTGNDVGVVSAWFSDVRVESSRFTGQRIAVWSNAEVTVRRSWFTRNTTAVLVYEGAAQVSRSVLVDNPRAVTVGGVGSADVSRTRVVGGDVALTADPLGTVVVRDSAVAGAGTGLLVQEGAATVERVAFRRNGVGLRYLGSDWGTTTVRDSVFDRNGDGILSEADDPALELGGDAATRNARWGIYAPGAVDLGGNSARHNGRDPQCVGVVCAP